MPLESQEKLINQQFHTSDDYTTKSLSTISITLSVGFQCVKNIMSQKRRQTLKISN